MWGRCFGVPLMCFLWKWLKLSFSGCTSQPAPLQPQKPPPIRHIWRHGGVVGNTQCSGIVTKVVGSIPSYTLPQPACMCAWRSAHCEAATMATHPTAIEGSWCVLKNMIQERTCVSVCWLVWGVWSEISHKHLTLRKQWVRTGSLNLSYETTCFKLSLVWTCFINSLTLVSPLCWQPKCPCPGCPRSRLWSHSTCKRRQVQCNDTHPVLNKSTPAEQSN